ncbi:unnamed protein product, partial [marine sediment metagenome]
RYCIEPAHYRAIAFSSAEGSGYVSSWKYYYVSNRSNRNRNSYF